MANDKKLSVKAFWDHDCVPAGEMSERGLLLRIDAPEIVQSLEPEKSLNLALVIDASGSMRDWRLEAAKQAGGVAAEANQQEYVHRHFGDRKINLHGFT